MRLITQALQARQLLLARIERYYHGRRILITGGAGFIGSHLAERLVAAGAQVTVLDNLSTGNIDNLGSVLNRLTFIEGDIRDKSSLMLALQDQELVFHLAASVSVQESMERPRPTFEVNTVGTLNLLEAARLSLAPRIIFSSSAAVYGNQSGMCRETDPIEPISMYGASKLSAEMYCQLYAKQYQVPAICLRYFNVFGPRQQAQSPSAGVVARFTYALARDQEIVVYGDGEQTRDFIPVEQVVEANLFCAMLPTSRLQGQPVNIGFGAPRSINQLLAQLCEHLGKEAKISYLSARPGDIRHSVADCARYHEYLMLIERETRFYAQMHQQSASQAGVYL